jgi:Uma2 family endonuclease
MLKTPIKQREQERLPLPSPYRIAARPSNEIEYPESDGEPMAETDTHRDLMTDALLHPLKERYRDDPNVYVSGNLFLYYEEGDPSAVVAPDVFVVFGVPGHRRRIYKLWEEGRAPDVVFELTSEHTYRADLSDKRLIYESLGVREYFMFDPLKDYLRPSLQGFRLNEARYFVSVLPQPWDAGEWQIESQVLGLTLRSDGSLLRLYDPELGRCLLTRFEETEARRRAEARAEAAEAELARLRAQLEQQEN